MYALEKSNISPICILSMLMPNIIYLFTLKLVHMWYEESIAPWVAYLVQHGQISHCDNCEK